MGPVGELDGGLFLQQPGLGICELGWTTRVERVSFGTSDDNDDDGARRGVR